MAMSLPPDARAGRARLKNVTPCWADGNSGEGEARLDERRFAASCDPGCFVADVAERNANTH